MRTSVFIDKFTDEFRWFVQMIAFVFWFNRSISIVTLNRLIDWFNTKFIAHTIYDHMTNVPLPLTLLPLLLRLFFDRWYDIRYFRCTLSSYKFKSSTSITFVPVCYHSYFTWISITIWRWNRTHLCVKCKYTHMLTFYNVLASFGVCPIFVFALTCLSVHLKL